MERHIEKVCNIASRAYSPCFQIQFLLGNISESDLRAIKFCQIKLFRSIKRRKKQQKSFWKKKQKKMKQTEAITEKANDRMRKTRSRHNISRKSNVTNRVSTFKKIIQQGPNFICIVCNRCLYRK